MCQIKRISGISDARLQERHRMGFDWSKQDIAAIPNTADTKRTSSVNNEEAAALGQVPRPLKTADQWGCRELDPQQF